MYFFFFDIIKNHAFYVIFKMLPFRAQMELVGQILVGRWNFGKSDVDFRKSTSAKSKIGQNPSQTAVSQVESLKCCNFLVF